MILLVDENAWKADLDEFLSAGDKIALVGLGNEFKEDDGAGIQIIRKLMSAEKNERFLLIEAGRNLLNFLPEIEEGRPDRILFMDAGNLGATPGTIAAVSADQINERGLSTHENNLSLAMAYLERTLPNCRILFLGIQFESMEMTEELTLTREIKKAVEQIANLIIDKMKRV